MLIFEKSRFSTHDSLGRRGLQFFLFIVIWIRIDILIFMRICQKQFIQILEQGLILSEGVTLTLPPSAYLGPLAGKLVPSMVPDIGFKLLQGSSIGNLAHYQLCGHIQNINLLQIGNRKINISLQCRCVPKHWFIDIWEWMANVSVAFSFWNIWFCVFSLYAWRYFLIVFFLWFRYVLFSCFWRVNF